ncbi:hypothetical protein JNUCC1_01587 [Lentibacillus sp. JNUCC-1]|uniref:TIGR04104 family putative zinc finger protein n=1 Tax=Lentibacillus sp. JNUCC-1 TaxID=2654513 RepID=UPI0012E70BBA|nr:TIGR04104 family putative zinc finger protein [Lentibacillus sp. JNUCC-1]MUV37781.1 hypothetical protein [Lentibacillus sp. JNUCC-1]
MPTCEVCERKWTWKQTVKKTSTLDHEMSCPYCGEKQYQTQRSKLKVSFLTAIVLSPLLIQLFFDVPGVILLSLFPVLAAIAFLLHPFLVDLSSDERYFDFYKS